jgi:hypothetical protein
VSQNRVHVGENTRFGAGVEEESRAGVEGPRETGFERGVGVVDWWYKRSCPRPIMAGAKRSAARTVARRVRRGRGRGTSRSRRVLCEAAAWG